MRPAHIAPLDIGRAAGSGDQDRVARMGPIGQLRSIVLEMGQDIGFLQHHDMMEGQERQQDRRIGARMHDQGPAFGDTPKRLSERCRLVRGKSGAGVKARPVECGQRRRRFHGQGQ